MQHRQDLSPNVGEDDLHAFVDGQLAAERHREVMSYLAVHPDAADRISVFLRQRVELAALRERLSDRERAPEPDLATLERALCRVVRRQRRVGRVLGAGSLAAALALAATGAMGLWLTGGGGSGERAASGPRQVAEASAEARTAWRQVTAGADTVAAVEDAGDSAVLWLQAHLKGRSLKQPDLEVLGGLRFVGSAPLRGAFGPAIRLVYADEAGGTFDLYVGVRQSGVEFAASLVPEGHVSISWQQDPLVFTLVAPKGSTRLGDVMRSATALLDPAPVATEAALAEAGPGDGAASDRLGAAGAVVSGGNGAEAVGAVVPRAMAIPMPKPEFSKPL